MNNEIKRGVVFIKEIVSKPALTFVANTIYKENYVTLPMARKWEENKLTTITEYSWKLNNKLNFIKVISSNKMITLEENSKVEFIAEHYCGYAKISKNKTVEYEVKHKKWIQYPVKEYVVSVDFATNYGSGFHSLDAKKPASVFLIEGSEISVENKKSY